MLDISRPVRMLEGVDRLGGVPLGWTHTGNRESMRVATRRVLEQPGEFGISARNVRGSVGPGPRWVSKSRDDISESKVTVDRDLLDRLERRSISTRQSATWMQQ